MAKSQERTNAIAGLGKTSTVPARAPGPVKPAKDMRYEGGYYKIPGNGWTDPANKLTGTKCSQVAGGRKDIVGMTVTKVDHKADQRKATPVAAGSK